MQEFQQCFLSCSEIINGFKQLNLQKESIHKEVRKNKLFLEKMLTGVIWKLDYVRNKLCENFL